MPCVAVELSVISYPVICAGCEAIVLEQVVPDPVTTTGTTTASLDGAELRAGEGKARVEMDSEAHSRLRQACARRIE